MSAYWSGGLSGRRNASMKVDIDRSEGINMFCPLGNREMEVDPGGALSGALKDEFVIRIR
jgi:hypothetical protein